MSERGVSERQKRLLESPENINTDSKISKFDSVSLPASIDMTPPILNPHPPSHDGERDRTIDIMQKYNLDERDKAMLFAFQQLLDIQFNKFSTEHITPIQSQITECQAENTKLREEVKCCVERINVLENVMRESNLIFSNVPATSDHHKALEDICLNQLKLTAPITIDKVIPIKENQTTRSTTLLVSFGSRGTAERVIRNAKNLKGTNMGISRDLPKETREKRNKLLLLRRKILNTGTPLNVKVYGNCIIVDKIKLAFENNSLVNDKVDGKQFIHEKFNINIDEIFCTSQQQ